MDKAYLTNWFSLKAAERGEIFQETGKRAGLPATAIEKDWWVCLALNLVFSSEYAPHFVFKGGTSLSKGWNLIERFSEDIDLAIDRSFLGFEGDLSKTQVKKLRKASSAFISKEFTQTLAQRINDLEIPNLSLLVREFRDSDKDPMVIELEYKTLTADADYLKPKVLIEIRARSLIEPHEERKIHSIISSQFPERDFADPDSDIPVVVPKRTFLEKAFLLHEEFQKPTGQVRVIRLSRHLYDLDKLSKTDHADKALADTELYQSIIAHREKFNLLKGIDYKLHHPESIDFIPPREIIKAWEEDYKRMQESMIYGESRNFGELITDLEKLRSRFRKAQLP